MKRKSLSILIMSLVLIGLPVTEPLFAQVGQGAQQSRQQYYRMYDVNSVETIEGTVTEVIYRTGKVAGMEGVEVSVKTASAIVPVHLGPRWYIEQQDPIEEGDRLTVTGSRITFEGEKVLIAATLRRGEMTLMLRDRNGFPAWRGWRMNRRSN